MVWCVACKNKPNSSQKKDTFQAKTQLEKMKPEWVENMPQAKSLPFLIEPCESSTNYQRNNWPGENSCVWAMQKELLEDLPEYVVKKGNGLSFQTDQGSWKTITNTRDSQLMLNAYLPDHHVFILKYFNAEACEKYGIYDPKENKLTTYEGKFYLSPDQSYFATVPSKECKGKNLILGRFSKGKGIITNTVSVSNPVLTLRWKDDKLAISGNNDDEKGSFQILDLP